MTKTKLKQSLTVIALCTIIGLLNSCDKTSKVDALKITPNSINFNADGGNQEATASIQIDRIEVNKMGEGWLTASANTNKITITTAKNDSENARFAAVTIFAGDQSASINVEQAGKSGSTPPNPGGSETPKAEDFQWATCDVMVKIGHAHGNGKMHGNSQLPGVPVQNEQHFQLINNNGMIKYKPGKGVAEHGRILVQTGRELYAFVLNFKDANGQEINGQIANKDKMKYYQIMYHLSDKNDQGQDYTVREVRSDAPWAKWTFNGLQEHCDATPKMFTYTYRDSDPWNEMVKAGQEEAGLMRINDDIDNSSPDKYAPQEHTGLKGHFVFLPYPEYVNGDANIDPELPEYNLSIRLMYIPDGKKCIADINYSNQKGCNPSHVVDSKWVELFRYNLPMRIISHQGLLVQNPNKYFDDMAREYGEDGDHWREVWEDAGTDSDQTPFHL